ncbi:uncharacterized protein YcfL [Clostridium beijerinckii]|uniref:hypothetical protein n=1 Tax=Clostridium beijerinckii TaxID=1520 RepID=UPI001DF95C61|nr:hypothetical protein [Clostridium beijerinckii]NRZ34962.1 uncharacterized protein YcfL [Clostridium beijerinckii]
MKKYLVFYYAAYYYLLLVGCGSSAKKYTAEEYGNKLKDAGVTIENMEVTTTENDKNPVVG